MKARQLMTAKPVVLTPDASIELAAETMRYQNVGCILVVNDLERPVPVGMITARDIAVRCVARNHSGPCRVSDHMTPGPVHAVAPDADEAEIIELMREAKIRRLPVVSDDGIVIGLVSQGDLPQVTPRGRSASVAGRRGGARIARFFRLEA